MTNEPTQPLPESVAAIIKSAAKKISLESSRQFLSAGDCECILSAALAAPIQELLNAAEEATLSDIRKFFGDNCTMQEAPALRLFADYDVAHSYRKIMALARLIAAAESRGRNAGLEEIDKEIIRHVEFLKYEIRNAGDYEHLKTRIDEDDFIIGKIRALKTSASEVKS